MDTKKKNRRWRLIADAKIQGSLCIRLAIYWVGCQIAMCGTMLFFAFMLDAPEPSTDVDVWRFIVPGLIVSSMVLPIALFDLVAFSNCFAGPMHQFRKKLKVLVGDGKIQTVYFRKGDFYPDLRDDFNQLCKKMETQNEEIQRLQTLVSLNQPVEVQL